MIEDMSCPMTKQSEQFGEPPEDKKTSQLEAADMYELMAIQDLVDSNNIASARERMEKLAPVKRCHPSALYLTYQIYSRAGEWNEAIQMADLLFSTVPDCASTWVILAEATCHKPEGGIAEAKEILLKAESKFPADFLIAFKLASYCMQLQQLDEADKWLKQALAIDRERGNQIAAEDENLKNLSSIMANRPSQPTSQQFASYVDAFLACSAELMRRVPVMLKSMSF